MCNKPAKFRVVLAASIINFYENQIHIVNIEQIKKPFFICFDCLNDEELMPNHVFFSLLERVESIINLKLFNNTKRRLKNAR